MKETTIRTVCECQARLTAVLDEGRHVLSGSATGPDQVHQSAPAHSLDIGETTFAVGWLCPFCGRNTTRSVSVASLVWREVASAPSR